MHIYFVASDLGLNCLLRSALWQYFGLIWYSHVPFCFLGEGGKAVVIDKDKLSPEEKKKYDDGWQNNAFNQYASDMISLHRSLDDVRDAE